MPTTSKGEEMTPYCKHHEYIVYTGKAAKKCEPYNCRYLTWLHDDEVEKYKTKRKDKPYARR